ncbi:MAG: hypothetical protein GY855_16615, partial [candidate division Zixibacteria bacterium]|nr:hypothetical protein [candidate division Zixibacteria bacterium]
YGKDAFNDEDFHSDIGLAVKVWRFLRVNFAKPIDTPDDDLRVTMRVSVPF